MSSIGAALGAAFGSSTRAEASRSNGAKSRGPKTPEGKARSSQNALKHGLRAEKFVVVGDEDAADYNAHEQALVAELAPEGVLQSLLVRRIAAAAWRLERADRIEAELFGIQGENPIRGWGRLGLALIRDGNGTRSFETLLRYRAAAEAQLMRALRTLKALKAEAAPARPALPGPQADSRAQENPIEPKTRRNPGEAARAAAEPAAPARRPRPDLVSGARPGHPNAGAPNEREALAAAGQLRPNEPPLPRG